MYFFFFNDTATTEIYTLSLHDALPICLCTGAHHISGIIDIQACALRTRGSPYILHGSCLSHTDRKSTRLNSSHGYISYAVFCLKKKKRTRTRTTQVLLAVSNTPPLNAR